MVSFQILVVNCWIQVLKFYTTVTFVIRSNHFMCSFVNFKIQEQNWAANHPEQTSGAEWNGSWISISRKIQGFFGRNRTVIVLRLCYSALWPFLCYCTSSQLQQLPPMCNAFTVLVSSQRQLSLPGLPAPVTVCTKKDKLYNNFWGLLKEKNTVSSCWCWFIRKEFCEDKCLKWYKSWSHCMVALIYGKWMHLQAKKAICSCSLLLCKIHWLQPSSAIQAQEEVDH